MGTTKPKGSVRVRGTCRAGHVTEARSDPGRVTWEGTCSADGCDLPVKAKRMPREQPEVTAAATPAPPEDADKPNLRRVDYAAPTPKPRGTAKRPDKPAADKPAADGAADRQAPAAVQDADGDDKPADSGPVTGGAGGEPRRRGLLGRRRGDRPRQPAAFKLPWED